MPQRIETQIFNNKTNANSSNEFTFAQRLFI